MKHLNLCFRKNKQMHWTVLSCIVVVLCKKMDRIGEYHGLKSKMKNEGFEHNEKNSNISTDDIEMDANSDDTNPGRNLVNGFLKEDGMSQRIAETDDGDIDSSQAKRLMNSEANREFSDYDLLDSTGNTSNDTSSLHRPNKKVSHLNNSSDHEGSNEKSEHPQRAKPGKQAVTHQKHLKGPGGNNRSSEHGESTEKTSHTKHKNSKKNDSETAENLEEDEEAGNKSRLHRTYKKRVTNRKGA